jgi:hypothetical protein
MLTLALTARSRLHALLCTAGYVRRYLQALVSRGVQLYVVLDGMQVCTHECV